MKLAIAFLTLAFLLGCAAPPEPGPVNKPRKIQGVQGFEMGEPIKYQNAVFVPVLSTPRGDQDRPADVATLAEAKKMGWVEIIEVPGAEQVDTLRVRNNGPKPLLLLAGDLLLGGKQDRVVAKDVLIQPGETREVPVYCVEHGRWSGGHKKFDYSETMVPDSVRKAVQYDNQQAVWDNVGAANAEAVATPQSSSIRELTNDKDMKEKVAKGMEFVKPRLAGKNVVGVLFVLNGEIRTFEVFGSPELFAAAHKPILDSFLAEAAVNPGSPNPPMRYAEWSSFISRCLTAQDETVSAGYARVAGAGVRGNQYKAADSAPAMHGSFEPTK